MRALLREWLTADEDLTAGVPAERWFGDRSVVDTPIKPFVICKFGGQFPGQSRIRTARYEVWVHDEVGDYGFIEGMLQKIEARMAAASQVNRANVWLMEAVWETRSPDLFNEMYQTNTMMTSFRIVGSGW